MADSRTVGILGGMGPLATAYFFQTLLESTTVEKDWDHLRTIIDSNPHIPSRSRHHLFDEASPVPGMIDSCLRLQAWPVDLIVVPCNSACRYLPDVRPALDVDILDIIEVTADAVAAAAPKDARVAVFGGVITYELRTYEPFLAERGLRYHPHSPTQQRRVEALIEQLKIGGDLDECEAELRTLVRSLGDSSGADLLVYGCTELSLLGGRDVGLPVVDSSLALALRTVEAARA